MAKTKKFVMDHYVMQVSHQMADVNCFRQPRKFWCFKRYNISTLFLLVSLLNKKLHAAKEMMSLIHKKNDQSVERKLGNIACKLVSH